MSLLEVSDLRVTYNAIGSARRFRLCAAST